MSAFARLCRTRSTRRLSGCFVTSLLFVVALHAENWPQWRGPQGDGSSRETGLPLTWDAEKGIAWKCKLPEWGDSTPAVWDNAIFLTSQVDDKQLLLVKIDRRTGKIEWTREVGSGTPSRVAQLKKDNESRKRQQFHNSQNMASPSPVTDGKTVVAHFGQGELAAFDFAGKQLWRRNLQDDHGVYTIWWGHANSPVLVEDLVICVCMQDSLSDLTDKLSPSYVVAYDLHSGQQRWKTMRMTGIKGEPCDSYITPVFWQQAGQSQLILMGGQQLDAYDPLSGKQLWFLPGLQGNRVITGPVVAGDRVFATEGMRGPTLAVKLGGAGKRPPEDIVWRDDKNSPDSPTPTVCGERLYFVSDKGIAKCVDLASGKQLWKERVPGTYRASPLAADGRIYFLNQEGQCTVVRAAETYYSLAENRIPDTTIASPIASQGRLYLRGQKWLWCVE